MIIHAEETSFWFPAGNLWHAHIRAVACIVAGLKKQCHPRFPAGNCLNGGGGGGQGTRATKGMRSPEMGRVQEQAF